MKTKEEILDKNIINRFDDIDRNTFLTAMQEYADQFKPKWISINDSLPTEYGVYLIYTKYSGIQVSRWSDYNVTYGMPFKEAFFLRSPSKQHSKKHFTHWMPLPEKPEL